MNERHDLLAQVAANKRRTIYIMAGFTLFVVAVVAAFDLAFAGGPAFIAIAIVVALAMVWTGYYYSDRLAIAAAHGVEAGPTEYPQLHNLVEELCLGVGLPKPSIYIVNDPAPRRRRSPPRQPGDSVEAAQRRRQPLPRQVAERIERPAPQRLTGSRIERQ